MQRRHNFRSLRVWQLGMDMVDRIYDAVDDLPGVEKFGLRSQLTRAAVSVPSNLVEGSAKYSAKDFALYIERALGSAYEIETQLLICQRRDLLPEPKTEVMLTEIQTLQLKIANFHRHIKGKIDAASAA